MAIFIIFMVFVWLLFWGFKQHEKSKYLTRAELWPRALKAYEELFNRPEFRKYKDYNINGWVREINKSNLKTSDFHNAMHSYWCNGHMAWDGKLRMVHLMTGHLLAVAHPHFKNSENEYYCSELLRLIEKFPEYIKKEIEADEFYSGAKDAKSDLERKQKLVEYESLARRITREDGLEPT